MTSKGLAILGISVDTAAAALMIGGRLVAAAREERVDEFPLPAVRSCIQQAGISPVELDFVALDTVPRAEFNSALIASSRLGFGTYLRRLQPWMASRLHLRHQVVVACGGRYQGPIAFVDRQEAQTAAASYQCTLDEAAARVVWHRVLAFPRDRSATLPSTAVRQTTKNERVKDAHLAWALRSLNKTALTVAYPLLMLGRGSVSDGNDAHPKRASDYFIDSFGAGSPSVAARLLTTYADGMERMRRFTRARAQRRRAGEDIPDEIYTLW